MSAEVIVGRADRLEASLREMVKWMERTRVFWPGDQEPYDPGNPLGKELCWCSEIDHDEDCVEIRHAYNRAMTALSEEEGTPAKVDEWTRPRNEWCRCGRHYLGAKIASHTDLDEIRHTLKSCREDDDAPSPATPSEDAPCEECAGDGRCRCCPACIMECPRCDGSGRATPRGDR